MRPTAAFPVQHHGRPDRSGIARCKIVWSTGRQRYEIFVLRRRGPLAIELVDEPLKEPRFSREVVMFLLIVERFPTPVGRTEDRDALTVERNRFLMIQSQMLTHADLNTRRIQAIDVVRSGELSAQPAGVKPVLVWLCQQTHWHSARYRPQHSVADR